MDLSFESLFSAIIRTESEVEQEKKLCQEVKENIEVRRSKLENVTEAARELRHKKENLEMCLNYSTTMVTILKLREKYLEDTLTQKRREIQENSEKLNKASGENVINCINWADNILQDFHCNETENSFFGIHKRLQDAQSKVNNMVQGEQTHPQELLRLAETLQAQILDTDELIRQEKEAIQKLQVERHLLQDEPTSGVQFKKLIEKLTEYRSSQD